jgi:hypothetical protein
MKEIKTVFFSNDSSYHLFQELSRFLKINCFIEIIKIEFFNLPNDVTCILIYK